MIRRGMTDDAYFALPDLSVSMCKTLVQPGGPAKLRYILDHGEPPRRVFDVGHAAHALILGTGAELVEVPGAWTTKAAKEAVAAARDAGQVPLHSDDFEAAHAMALAVAGHPEAAFLLASGEPEVVLTGHIHGVEFRGKVDWLDAAAGRIVDLKTTVDASPAALGRACANYGYHLQAAAYLDLAAANGIDAKEFVFVFVEKAAPHLVTVARLDPEFIALGRRRVAAACALWERCTYLDSWPGYASPDPITAPVWALD